MCIKLFLLGSIPYPARMAPARWSCGAGECGVLPLPSHAHLQSQQDPHSGPSPNSKLCPGSLCRWYLFWPFSSPTWHLVFNSGKLTEEKKPCQVLKMTATLSSGLLLLLILPPGSFFPSSLHGSFSPSGSKLLCPLFKETLLDNLTSRDLPKLSFRLSLCFCPSELSSKWELCCFASLG